MIASDAGEAFARIAATVERAARAMAEARVKSRLLARAGDPRRWRRAALLWPTFSGD